MGLNESVCACAILCLSECMGERVSERERQ